MFLFGVDAVGPRLQLFGVPGVESVTELRFVTAVEVDADSCVHIRFRLPTYWCSPNFAFLMADDMRTAAWSLPWVRQVLIDLHDHMYSDTINQGLAQGHSFKATFAEEAAEALQTAAPAQTCSTAAAAPTRPTSRPARAR